MPSATRLDDKCTGHDACPPAKLAEGSDNVFINKKKAGRKGDKYANHSCPDHPSHKDEITSGSSSVFINGKPAARIGDSVSPGGTVQEGSPSVFIGG